MRKAFAGVAAVSLILVFLTAISLFFILPQNIEAVAVTEVLLDASNYYTQSTAVVTVNDTDLPGSIGVNVNSTTDPSGFALTLTSSGGSEIYNNTFNFTTTGSSDAGAHILRVTNGDTIWVKYNDTIINTSVFNHTVNATVVFNSTVFGTSHTANISIENNDTAANADENSSETTYAIITSPTNSTGINVTLTETGNNTGIFNGTFNFSTTDNNDTTDTLNVSAGDIITITYNDTLNTYGSYENATNTSRIATTATAVFNASLFFPANTGLVTVDDNDTNTNSSTYQTLVVSLNSTGAASNISVTLNETGVDTGIFNGTLTFRNGTSSDTSDILGTNETCIRGAWCTISVFYNDTTNITGDSTNAINTSISQLTANGTVALDLDYYGPSSNAVITVVDNDNKTNNDIGGVESGFSVNVSSVTNSSGIMVLLTETGVNTGVFNGTFNFSLTENNDTSDTLHVANNDNITVNYTDQLDPLGQLAYRTDNATFFNTQTGLISFNSTALNSTDSVFGINDTALLYVLDNDNYSNTNSSDFDTVNITITSSECSILITLNESSVDSGNFTVNGNFTFSTSTCSNSSKILKVNASIHNPINISYTDPKNGTSDTNATITNTTVLDNKNPVVSVVSDDVDTVYLPGETITINVTLDQAGGNISANFSTVDSAWSSGSETVTEIGNGSYKINHTINSGTTVTEGPSKLINITVTDAAGNGPVYYTSFYVTLSRLSTNATDGLNFSVLSPGGSNSLTLNITNNGTVNQTSISEYFDIFRERNFSYITAQNESKTFYFMILPNATRLVFNLTRNDSNVQLSSYLYNYQNTLVSSALNGTVTSVSSSTSTRIWKWVVITSNVSSGGVFVNPIASVHLDSNNWFNSTLSQNTYFANSSNTTLDINLTVPATLILPHRFNGTVKYNNTNTSVSANVTFNISSPQMWIESNISSPVKELPNGTMVFSANINTGNKTWEITINNTGNANLSGVSVNITQNFTKTSSQTINLTTDNVIGGSGVTVNSPQSISMLNITPGSFRTFTITFNTTNTTNQTTGLYDSYMLVTSENGQPYNSSNITLRINMTTVLNVTVLNTSYSDATPANPGIGENVTINVSVRYQTGEPVTNLSSAKLVVYDTSSSLSPTPTKKGFTNASDGTYLFNITTPGVGSNGTAEYGTHTIKIEANDSNTVNIGNGSTTYTLVTPAFEVTPPSSFSITTNSSASKSFTIENIGTGNSTSNVSINVTSNSSGLTVSGNTTKNITNGSSSSVSITFTSSTTTGNFLVIMNATSGNHYNSDTVVVTVNSNTSSDDTGGTTGQQQNTTASNISLRISSFESAFNITLGEYKTTDVTVENTGSEGIIALLNVTLGAGINTSLNISDCIISNYQDKCAFQVNFTVSNSTTTGDHSGSYTAYVLGDNATDTESFTIKIIPTEERKIEINTSYQEYVAILENLTAEFNLIKARGIIPEENLTNAEVLLDESKNLLNQIKNAIDSEDYITAESLQRDLNSLITRLREEMSALVQQETVAGQGMWWVYGIYIAIAAIIIAAGIFVYYIMMPPRSGYHVKYGFRKKSEGKLKELFKKRGVNREKNKFVPKKEKSSYTKHYEKAGTIKYGYKPKRDISGSIKKLFKKKKNQKSLNEFSKKHK